MLKSYPIYKNNLKKIAKKQRDRCGYLNQFKYAQIISRAIIRNILMAEYHAIRGCIGIVRESRENRS